MVGTTSKRALLLFGLACFLTTEGRGLSEVVETGRRKRNTEEVNSSETLLSRRRVRRSIDE